MVSDERLGTALPLAFLEAFPFPVLVFKTFKSARPSLFSRDTETIRSSRSAGPNVTAKLSRPQWTNEKWSALSEGRELDECLDRSARQALANWIEKEPDTEMVYGDGKDQSSPDWSRRGSEMSSLSTPETPTGPSAGKNRDSLLDTAAQQACITLSLIKPVPVTLQFTKMAVPIVTANSSLPSYFKVIFTTPVKSPISSLAELAVAGPMSPRPSSTHEGYISHRGSIDAESIPHSYSPSLYSNPGDGSNNEHNWARGSTTSDKPSRPDSFRYAFLPTLPEDADNIPGMSLDPSQDCRALLLSTDWSKTSLGPISEWPQGLHMVISVMLATPDQAAIWLGEDLNCLYNQRYSEIVFGHGPNTYGQPMKVLWSEIWDELGGLMESAYQGQPVYRVNEELLMRDPATGLEHEAYHTWRATPIIDDDGRIIGCWNYTNENTEKVIGDRRVSTLREMAARTSISRSVAEYHAAVMEVLEMNEREAPFALLYKAAHDVDNERPQPGKRESVLTTSRLTLVDTIGVPEGHSSAPKEVEIHMPRDSNRSHLSSTANRINSPTLSAISALSNGSHRLTSEEHVPLTSWPFKKALMTKRCVLVKDVSQLIEGYTPRVFGTLPQAAIIVPICSDSTAEMPTTVLILGLHPRSPLNNEYEDWLLDLRSQLAATLITAEACEQEAAAQEAAARLERAKTTFFQNASHELSTPLALLAGPTEDLLQMIEIPAQKRLLSMMQRNVARLQRLVSSLMDFSRLEAGKMQASFVPVNIASFTEELTDLFRAAMEKAKLDFEFRCQDVDERMCFIDTDLWEKIIFNLVGNALKYTQSGYIRVVVKNTADYVECSIEDSGVGIPPEDLPRVTDRFHRVDQQGRSFEGTGIGLALAIELVQLHGGTMSISSQTREQSPSGHGSQFRVRMPWGYEHLPRSAVNPDGAVGSFGSYGRGLVEEAMQWMASSREGHGSRGSATGSVEENSDAGTSGDNPTKGFDKSTFYFEKSDVVLIADDNRDMRYYLRSIFEPFCHVIEAKDGRQAYEMAIASPPQLIVTDVMMPKMNGLELLTAVKAHPATRHTPIILVSAVSGDDIRVDSLMVGADDFLMKPFRPKDLLARGHLHLQLGKRRQQLELAFERRTTEMKILADYSPTGIIRTDMSGHIEYANAAWKAMLGFDDTSNLDTWDQKLPLETREELTTAWEEICTGTTETKELTWKWMNGRTMTGNFIRLDLAATGLSGVLGCVTDISHREELLNIAEDRRKEAEESKRQQELLIDLTSHEIRCNASVRHSSDKSSGDRLRSTDLNHCASLVKENLLDLREAFMKLKDGEPFYVEQGLVKEMAADIEALESIHQCGLVQERIAGDVLSMARIQLDMLQICDIKTDVLGEARKVFSVFTSEAKTKDIKLSLSFGESFERLGVRYIMADPTRLGQVLSNLISNAIRFTASSDVRHIAVSYEIARSPPTGDNCLPPADKGAAASPGDELFLYVSVKDSGPGLAPKELALLFQRFSQSNKMIHTRYGGSGLGLFICRKITELMHGRIEVASEFGNGSSFRFFIRTEAAPLDDPYTEGPDIHGVAKKVITAIKNDVAQAERRKMHILIVEDNVINQTVLKRQLLKAGLTCDVANHGEEALDLMRVSQRPGGPETKWYDCVLMDLEMPVMDGFEAVRQIRRDEAAGVMERSLVIALTGNARQGQIDQALESGMDEVVIKPYKLAQLLSTMETMVERLEATKRAGIEQESA